MNNSLRKEIIALGDKGMHRALLAVYAEEILNLVASKMPEKPPKGVDKVCFHIVMREVKSILKGKE